MEIKATHRCAFCGLHTRKSVHACNKMVFDSGSFYSMPTLGSIVPGWLLIISKEHFLCAGALPDDRHSHLEAAVSKAIHLIDDSFGSATVFEHGPSKDGTPVGCGIDHLHIHVAPLPSSLTSACTDLFGSDWHPVQQGDIKSLHRAGISYMMVREPGRKEVWASPPVGVRQPLRRAIAHMVGLPERFDYHTDAFDQNVDATLGALSLTI